MARPDDSSSGPAQDPLRYRLLRAKLAGLRSLAHLDLGPCLPDKACSEEQSRTRGQVLLQCSPPDYRPARLLRCDGAEDNAWKDDPAFGSGRVESSRPDQPSPCLPCGQAHDARRGANSREGCITSGWGDCILARGTYDLASSARLGASPPTAAGRQAIRRIGPAHAAFAQRLADELSTGALEVSLATVAHLSEALEQLGGPWRALRAAG